MNGIQRPLSSLPVGKGSVITVSALKGPLALRLEELGLFAGTGVICRGRAPSGSPGAYEALGTTLALRREDAERILVQPWD